MSRFVLLETKMHHSILVSNIGDEHIELYKVNVISITTDNQGNVLKVNSTTSKFRDKESLFKEFDELTKPKDGYSHSFRNQQRIYRDYLEWQYKKNN